MYERSQKKGEIARGKENHCYIIPCFLYDKQNIDGRNSAVLSFFVSFFKGLPHHGIITSAGGASNMVKTYNICVTGHRPNKLFGYNIHSVEYNPMRASITVFLQDILIRTMSQGYTNLVCYSGMALGVDSIFAEEVLKMKSNSSFIYLRAAVPFRGQESKWPEISKMEYRNLLARADEVIYVSDDGYAPWKMQRRNTYMVDNSDEVLAIYDGWSRGGTRNCIDYAVLKRVPVTRISPDGTSMQRNFVLQTS